MELSTISAYAWQIAVAVAISLYVPVHASAQQSMSPRAPDAPQGVVISATSIEFFEPRDPSRRRFGALEFRGGIELSSKNKDFGGISGLKVFADGTQFLALTDKSRWLQGRIVYQAGAPVGIADAKIAPMLGPDGRTLAARGWYDTEALTEDNGTVYVGIERVNKIVRYDFAKYGLLARGQVVAIPRTIERLPNNRGLECLAAIPKGMPHAGALVAISERALDAAGNLKAVLIGGAVATEFSVVRGDDFDVSDCAVAPGGDLLVLKRRFSWTSGLAIRLRRIALSSIRANGNVDGQLLFEADLGYQIDNMEALGVHTAKDGTTIVTMMSDDNFSILQRTILLQFAIAGE